MSLIAYVGCYPAIPGGEGGISVLEVSADGTRLALRSQVPQPAQAGYLAYAPSTGTLYAVDEAKTDGRGPVYAPAAVHAFRVSQEDGSLTWLNSQPAPGPRPTYIGLDEAKGILVTANHGDFDHVEHVVQSADGGWVTTYLYDDSTVVLYELEPDGRIGGAGYPALGVIEASR
jgi:6-phosphogluconolactonase